MEVVIQYVEERETGWVNIMKVGSLCKIYGEAWADSDYIHCEYYLLQFHPRNKNQVQWKKEHAVPDSPTRKDFFQKFHHQRKLMNYPGK